MVLLMYWDCGSTSGENLLQILLGNFLSRARLFGVAGLNPPVHVGLFPIHAWSVTTACVQFFNY